MRVLTLRFATLATLFTLFSAVLVAQPEIQIAAEYLYENSTKYGINQDIQWRVSDNYTDTDGLTHVYLQQTYNGIDVDIAQVGVHLKNDEVVYAAGRFVAKISKLLSNREQITVTNALQIALQDRSLNTSRSLTPSSTSRGANKETLFNLDDIALQEVKSQLLYIRHTDTDVRLVWDVDIYEKDAQNWWSVRVDAQTGEVLKVRDQVLHCDFGAPNPHDYIRKVNELAEMTCEEQQAALASGHLDYTSTGTVHEHNHAGHAHTHAHTHASAAPVAANSYRIFPLTVESPNHGGMALVTNPEANNTTASPFGWHDTNGAVGAEYTITRGNNVWAQEDQNGNNGTGYSPDGGANLCFDFTFDPNADPETGENRDAAITNLFVWNNYMHDIYYNYGFTEACGNFQENNYGKGGSGGDSVNADAQDGSGTNNANFSTPTDGGNPRMQMFLWTASATTAFTVNSPGGIAGSYGAVVAQFGQTTFSGITGDLVIANDGTAAPSEACNALTNGGAINGNIALIDRGNCEFGLKCLNAQNAGAIAAVVCNNVAGAPIAMAPGANGASVTIPCVMLSQGDCATIRAQIPTVNVTMSASGGNFQIDGDYDNGIIAHEYGHGISIRLTGGAGNSGCLSNAEQMGEGWSDWWGLVLTTSPANVANPDMPRGIGTYAVGEPTSGGGIRPFPYTRDMAVNPVTYASTNNTAQFSQPHGIGSVWCAMLWDLHWNLVDQYGYDYDLYNGTGGNNRAMRLVTEACKLQPCGTGFVDARDAILQADQNIYGGANECIIWETFANRGLGTGASQGGSGSRTDQTESFDLPPGLGGGSSTPTFSKTADKSLAVCGEEITFTLEAAGAASACGAAPSNVDIADILPAGLTYVPGSASNGGTESGGTITWPQIATLNGTVTYTYRATVDCNNLTPTPAVPVNDDVESGTDPLATISNNTGLSNWTIVNTQSNSGSSSWYAEELEADPQGQTDENQYLVFGPMVLTGTSSMSFAHFYDTENDWDGGKVEISTDGGTSWTDVDPSIYGGSFLANDPSNLGFSGLMTTWTTVNIDLSSYAGASGCDGSDTYIRFNFYYDPLEIGTAGNGVDDGWYIDDVSINTESAAVVVNQATITQGGSTQMVSECVGVEVREVCVEPKVFLQGPLSGTTMATDLNTNTLIPNTSPYADSKSFTGALPATAIDWVEVEIRDDNTATPGISEAQSGILLSDGRVVNPDGSPLCFNQAPGMWYVVIKHRNHLGIMTANAVMLN